MKIYDIVKKTGIVTSKYPYEPYIVEEYFRGKPTYNYANCIGCAACGVACPSNAISVKWESEKKSIKWRYDCGRCIFCGRCDEVCPTAAIRLSNDFELTVKFDKSALIQEGELESELCSVCGKAFLSKKFIQFCEQRLSTLSEQRLEEAKKYLHICPSCKKNRVVEMMTNKEYKAVE